MADDSAAGTGDVKSGAEHFITKKYGPLPLVVWVMLGATAVLIYKRFHPSAPKAKASTSTAIGNPNPVGNMNDTSGSILDSLQSLDRRLQAEEAAKVGAVTASVPASGGSNIADMVSSLYRGILGRAPDAAGLAHYVDMASTQGMGAVTQEIQSSPEATIDHQYASQLGRAPDASGLAYWMKRLQSDPNESAAFAASALPEATVMAQYQNILHRAPDAGGLAYWIGRFLQNPASEAGAFAASAANDVQQPATAPSIGQVASAPPVVSAGIPTALPATAPLTALQAANLASLYGR